MKTLLVLDEKNYQDTVRVLEKFAVRGIIRKKGKLAVQQAGKKEDISFWAAELRRERIFFRRCNGKSEKKVACW